MLKDWPKIVALIALCFSGTAAADDDLGKQLIKDFVNDVVTLEGTFIQSLTDAEGEILERTSGTLEIERPGRFRWKAVR